MKVCRNVLIGGAFAVVLGCGCQNTVNTVENADKSMTENTINDKRFVTDSFLRDRLKLRSINTALTQDGLLRVQISAVNTRVGWFSQMWSSATGENPYRIKYKFTWFDNNGMAVDSIISTWHEISVNPGENIQIQTIGPSKACRDFLLNIKEAD